MNGFYRVQIMFKGEEASNKVLKYLTFDEVDDLCVDYNKIIPIEDTMENRIAKWNAIGLPNNTRYLKANANECELTFDNDLFVKNLKTYGTIYLKNKTHLLKVDIPYIK